MRRMEALPVSVQSGRAADANGHAPILDDVGATLLRLAGFADPSVYGYDGKHLAFLVEA